MNGIPITTSRGGTHEEETMGKHVIKLYNNDPTGKR